MKLPRAMLRDEAVYGPRTDKFDPERFLKDGRLNPDIPHPNEAFGFGRRICAGQAMAEASIWITIASIVSVFDVSVYVDKDGTPIPPSGKYSSGLLWYVVSWTVFHGMRMNCLQSCRTIQDFFRTKEPGGCLVNSYWASQLTP